jgi:hypothetical protein
MSGASPVGIPAYDAIVYQTEMLRQSTQQKAQSDFGNRAGAQPAADELASFKASEIAKFRALKAAAIANGVSPVAFMQALYELTGSG